MESHKFSFSHSWKRFSFLQIGDSYLNLQSFNKQTIDIIFDI